MKSTPQIQSGKFVFYDPDGQGVSLLPTNVDVEYYLSKGFTLEPVKPVKASKSAKASKASQAPASEPENTSTTDKTPETAE